MASDCWTLHLHPVLQFPGCLALQPPGEAHQDHGTELKRLPLCAPGYGTWDPAVSCPHLCRVLKATL